MLHRAARIVGYKPEVLCAVLLREPLWLEARMDDQALFEGSVVLSDEDGPGGIFKCWEKKVQVSHLY